ncbi:MAG: 30S ribosomal protein S1 [Armatimonadetes bacterium]|nr:30S ribosomal protein S1 [Armatimonadota bacterium]
MTHERTEETGVAAGTLASRADAAPQVPPVSAAVPTNGGRARSVRFGRVIESGGEVPTELELEARPIDYEETFRPLREGEVVAGTVVHIDREGVLVDVGMKSEGIIPPNELSRDSHRSASEMLKVGDRVDVLVLNTDDEDGQLILSKKRADFEKAWDRVIEAYQAGRTIIANVSDRVKGGLVVDLGIRGFVPASHVGTGKIRNLEKYIGQPLPLKVIEVDRDRRKVVLSHRLATEEEREAQRQETLAGLAEGQVRNGVVRRITEYGAFVDIGGVDGLLHISEMSWTRIKHPSEVLKVSDEIQVMVLKTNLEQGRISLGLRQILPDPWTEVQERYQPGDVVHGAVTRLVPFGAFVQLDGGVEGIIPNNELSSQRISKPEDVVQVGDHVEVRVLDVRPEERRITLSLRQVVGAEGGEERYGRDADRVTIGDRYGHLVEENEAGEEEEEG